jgi:hypothetical protein
MKTLIYLGDGVYATFEPGGFHPLTLTTGTHVINEAESVIYFEDKVLRILIAAIQEVLGNEKSPIVQQH